MEKSQRGCGAYVGRQQKGDPDRLWGDGTLGWQRQADEIQVTETM